MQPALGSEPVLHPKQSRCTLHCVGEPVLLQCNRYKLFLLHYPAFHTFIPKRRISAVGENLLIGIQSTNVLLHYKHDMKDKPKIFWFGSFPAVGQAEIKRCNFVKSDPSTQSCRDPRIDTRQELQQAM